jgi:rubrerythrin
MKTKFIYSILLVTAFFSETTDIQASGSNQMTIKNLQDAFIGETTASAKYAAYSKKAKEEGFPQIGLLFEAASKAESIHAGNHKSVLKQLSGPIPEVKPQFEVKSTKENLEDALKGESYEINTMYPDFIKQAQKENVSLALISLNYAYQTEKKHKALYSNAIEAMKNGSVKKLADVYYVCSTCGNTYDNEAPERCGISMTPKERFIRFSL